MINLICPFCLQTHDRFHSFGLESEATRNANVIGAGPRENAICPSCSSLDRERLVFLYLLRETSIFRSKKTVLHVAPELNLSRKIRHSAREYITIDLNRSDVTHRMSITDLNLPSDFVDFLICNHVLEHVADDRLAMSELYRVMKRGGTAVLQVPISWTLPHTLEDSLIQTPKERLNTFGQEDHVRIYAHDYIDRLVDVGFHVTLYDPVKSLGIDAVIEHALCPGEKVFVANKP